MVVNILCVTKFVFSSVTETNLTKILIVLTGLIQYNMIYLQ